ncbi:MAG: hypothetical protein AABY86_13610, partial [Bdellovibrionota bacterium]
PCLADLMLLPMLGSFMNLAMEDFNSRPSNPDARVFLMSTIFQMDLLAHNSNRVLCWSRRESFKVGLDSEPRPIVSILGALGGTLGPSVGRSVRGDPSFIIGYSSKTAVDPEEVQAQIQEDAVSKVRLLDQSLSFSVSMDLMQNMTDSARERLGRLISVVFDEHLVINAFQFQNIVFKKDIASQSFVGRDLAGNELRIMMPSICGQAEQFNN